MTDRREDAGRQRHRILVIYNPTAGRRRRQRLDGVLSVLTADGAAIDLRPTEKRGDAEVFARAASADDYDVLVVAGGDGTINEAVNGLEDRRLPVAIVPLGTANVLANEIGLGSRAAEIARTIISGRAEPVALGTVNGRRFIMMAGVGFDAFVVSRVSPGVKKLLGKAAYVLESLRALFTFPFPSYRVTVDGRSMETASLVVANGHYYGGTFVCAREAKLNDSRLFAVLFLKRGPLRALRYALWLAMGRLDRLPDVRILPASEIAVATAEAAPVHGDGDILAHLPARISVLPDQLALIMPGGKAD